jgi:prenyltransferase beta subunit
MRFLFCACAVSQMLHMLVRRRLGGGGVGEEEAAGVGVDGEVPFAFDVDRAVAYVKESQTYEGGFALCPGMEAHGGSTYCAVSRLNPTPCTLHPTPYTLHPESYTLHPSPKRKSL